MVWCYKADCNSFSTKSKNAVFCEPNFVANKPKYILVAMKVKADYFATKSQIAVFCELGLAASTVVAKNPNHVFGKIKG